MQMPRPAILLPAHFYVRHSENLEITNKITEFLSHQYALEFNMGTYWHGSVLRASSRMSFNISLYSEKEAYIVELQRLDGSGMLFGELYQNIDKMFKGQPTIQTEFEPFKSSKEETLEYIERSISMIKYHDEHVSLNGVYLAGDILTNKYMLTYSWETELLKILINIVLEKGILQKREHSMFSLTHVAKTSPDNFKCYIDIPFTLKLEELTHDESPHISSLAFEIINLKIIL